MPWENNTTEPRHDPDTITLKDIWAELRIVRTHIAALSSAHGGIHNDLSALRSTTDIISQETSALVNAVMRLENHVGISEEE